MGSFWKTYQCAFQIHLLTNWKCFKHLWSQTNLSSYRSVGWKVIYNILLFSQYLVLFRPFPFNNHYLDLILIYIISVETKKGLKNQQSLFSDLNWTFIHFLKHFYNCLKNVLLWWTDVEKIIDKMTLLRIIQNLFYLEIWISNIYD